MTEMHNVARFLLENDDYYIICHDRPDGDTFGSGTALLSVLEKLSKRAALFCFDAIPQRLDFARKFYDGKRVFFGASKFECDFLPKKVIAVDVASRQLVSADCSAFGETVDLAIDHHLVNTLGAKEIYADKNASSVGEIMTHIIAECEKISGRSLFDTNIASLLYIAVASDSGNFMYSNASRSTFLAASELMGYGIDNAEISRLLFEVKSMATFKSESLCISKVKRFAEGRLAFCAFSADDMKKEGITADDTETVVQILRQIEKTSVGIFAREKEEGLFKISVRSNDGFDACEFCEKFGGGGHKKAAGCVIKASIADVEKIVIDTALKMLK